MNWCTLRRQLRRTRRRFLPNDTTAKNIERQNNMTQSIQSAIDETGERSRKMVDVATDFQ